MTTQMPASTATSTSSAAAAASATVPPAPFDSMQSLLDGLLASSSASASGASASASASHLPPQLGDRGEASLYLRSLSTHSLADLRSQPDLLTFKAKDLDRQLSNLCITQTDAFVSLYEAEQSFAPSMASLSGQLDHLIAGSLLQLESAASAFQEASKQSLRERTRIQIVAEAYERGNLADLLELPKLVDTCVRARHHPEALQLGDHIVTLTLNAFDDQQQQQPRPVSSSKQTRFSASPGPSNAVRPAAGPDQQPSRHGDVLVSLLHETWTHLARMKMDLIASLQRPGVQLPAAKRNVALLRKLHALAQRINPLSKLPLAVIASLPDLRIDASQLCLCYLTARQRIGSDSLDKVVGASIDTAAYLRRYIDTWREGLTETFGIAVVVFADSTSDLPVADQLDGSGSGIPTPSFLLSAFAYAALDKLRMSLETQLPQLDRVTNSAAGDGKPTLSVEESASIFAALHTQLSYASAALSRYGLDFGHVLVQPAAGLASKSTPRAIESDPALDLLERNWLDVLQSRLTTLFDDELAAFSSNRRAFAGSARGDTKSSSSPPALPSSWLVSASRSVELIERQDAPASIRSTQLTLRPGADIACFPRFVTLLNGLMDIFNGLRLFAPRRLRSHLQTMLQDKFGLLAFELLLYAEGVSGANPAELLPAGAANGRDLHEQQDAGGLFDDLSEAESHTLKLELRKETEILLLSLSLTAFEHLVVRWSSFVLQRGVFGRDVDEVNQIGSDVETKLSELARFVDASEEHRFRESRKRGEDAEVRKAARLERLEAEKKKEEQRLRREEEAKRAREEAEEAERQRVAKVEAQAKAEAGRLKLEKEERERKEEEARRKVEEEERERERFAAKERKRKEEEEAAERKRKEEEAERQRKEEDAAAEEERKRQEEEAKRKRKDAEEKAEEERLRKQQQREEQEAEERRLRKEEEETRRQSAADEAEARAVAEAEAQRAEEERKQNTEEEAAVAAAEKQRQSDLEAERQRPSGIEHQEGEAAEAKASAVAAAAAIDGKQKQDDEQQRKQNQSLDAQAAPSPMPSAIPASEESAKSAAPPVPSSASSSSLKKTNLAEKLRLRKEQREREMAAAKLAVAAEAAQKEPEAEKSSNKQEDAAGHPDALPDEALSSIATEAVVEQAAPSEDQKPSTETAATGQEEQQQEDDAAEKPSAPDAEAGDVETTKLKDAPPIAASLEGDTVDTPATASPISAANEDEKDADDGNSEGEVEGEGESVPASPVPEADGGGGDGGGGGAKKNKRKK